jgi:hypothetical protein
MLKHIDDKNNFKFHKRNVRRNIRHTIDMTSHVVLISKSVQ